MPVSLIEGCQAGIASRPVVGVRQDGTRVGCCAYPRQRRAHSGASLVWGKMLLQVLRV